MARIRTIKPEMPGHPTIAALSRDARLLFVWLITDADDEGICQASPKRLAGQLFPLDDDVDGADVERWLQELESARLVSRYTHNAGQYLELTGWRDHQKISKPAPSRHPKPAHRASTAPKEEDAERGEEPHVEEAQESPGDSRESPGEPRSHAGARVLGPRSTVLDPGPDPSRCRKPPLPPQAEAEEPSTSNTIKLLARQELADVQRQADLGQTPAVRNVQAWLAAKERTLQELHGHELAGIPGTPEQVIVEWRRRGKAAKALAGARTWGETRATSGLERSDVERQALRQWPDLPEAIEAALAAYDATTNPPRTPLRSVAP